AEFFLAPDGKDSNPGTHAKPFQSINRAQEAARAQRAAQPESGVTVTFETGVYHLQRPLQFTSADSGVSAQQPVRYRAKPGASVIIRGGRAIPGWQPDAQRPGVWKARAGDPTAPAGDAWRFNQLWINGRRGIRARTPNYWDFRVLKGVTEEPLASG